MRASAGEMLLRAGIDVDAVRADLTAIDPSRVPVWAAPAWFRLFWMPWVSAMALPWGIYLHPRRFDDTPEELGALVVHELAHIDQWRRKGALRWLEEYVGDYRRARRAGADRRAAYRSIGMEVEARELARRHESV